MKNLIILCVVIVAAVSAMPFVDKNTAREGFILKYKRQKREEISVGNTKYGLKNGVPYVNHQVNLANSNGHKIDANAFASKDFHNHGPLNVGGNVNYAHQPSGAGLSISASKIPSGGTNVGAAGVYNVYKNGGFGVNLQGGYNQHFGGPFGNGRPQFGLMLNGIYRIPERGKDIP